MKATKCKIVPRRESSLYAQSSHGQHGQCRCVPGARGGWCHPKQHYRLSAVLQKPCRGAHSKIGWAVSIWWMWISLLWGPLSGYWLHLGATKIPEHSCQGSCISAVLWQQTQPLTCQALKACWCWNLVPSSQDLPLANTDKLEIQSITHNWLAGRVAWIP